MIAHKGTIGTAAPVHYYVVSNKTKLSRDQIETFTYHLCYNYFNWGGSIKVPAAVMYAKKLANYTYEIMYPTVSSNSSQTS